MRLEPIAFFAYGETNINMVLFIISWFQYYVLLLLLIDVNAHFNIMSVVAFVMYISTLTQMSECSFCWTQINRVQIKQSVLIHCNIILICLLEPTWLQLFQALPQAFTHAVGLPGHCSITLKTSMANNKSWEVHAVPRKTGNYRIGTGWRRFCRENNLKLGDICTFKVIDTTLWHVVVTRCKKTVKPALLYELNT